MLLSVVVTTYNKPRDLLRVLEGFRHQTWTELELLVCDDGSGPETAALVRDYAAGAPFPVHHVWQEDLGFRAARSRNNGARRAEGEVLVFADGDCVPTPEFLAVHAAAHRPDAFQAGERWLLSEEESAAVTVESIASGAAFAQVPARERKRVGGQRWKNGFYRWTGLKPDRPHLMTSNCSVPRAAFADVNGLDERYEGWGHEDEDLRRRLVARGYRPLSVVGQANCLHLWHAADPTFLGKRKLSPNWSYYERGFQLTRCRRGLTERGLGDLTARVEGPPALVEAARAALGLRQDEPPPGRQGGASGPGIQGGASGPGERLELLLRLDPGDGPPPPRGRAEVVVHLTAGPAEPARLRGAHLVLGPGLPLAGGELRGEQHPAVDPALARVGVRATRPLPPNLDAAALAEAARLLDVLL